MKKKQTPVPTDPYDPVNTPDAENDPFGDPIDPYSDSDNESFEIPNETCEELAGIYHARVVGWQSGFAQNGNRMINARFKLFANGMTVFACLSLVASARWKLTQTLKSLGIPCEGSVLRFKTDDVMGKPCRLQIKMEDWEGERRPRVEKVLPADGETAQLMLEPR